jgi:hypothetical protein
MQSIYKKDIEYFSHVCNERSALYNHVVETLAKCSTKQCPSCGIHGQKDLNCTHITCKCSVQWCYVCEKKWTEIPREHKCPSYLQDLYQGKYDAEKALRQFHKELQEKAIEEIKKNTRPADWESMMSMYFPMGIWDDEKE